MRRSTAPPRGGRTTIAQFAKITEVIGEDELIGFGLYGSDQGPSRWNGVAFRGATLCESRGNSDAPVHRQRSPAGADQESHLPAVSDAARVCLSLREDESALAERLARVEAKWSSIPLRFRTCARSPPPPKIVFATCSRPSKAFAIRPRTRSSGFLRLLCPPAAVEQPSLGDRGPGRSPSRWRCSDGGCGRNGPRPVIAKTTPAPTPQPSRRPFPRRL